MSRAAPSSNNSPNDVAARPLCKYFMSNCCEQGDLCLFLHDMNARPNMTCKYYLAGYCFYGKTCRYDHVRPKPHPIVSSTISALAPSTSKAATRAATATNCLEDVATSSNCVATSSKASTSNVKVNAWEKQLKNSEEANNGFSVVELQSELDGCSNSGDVPSGELLSTEPADVPLCPYFKVGYCLNGEMCTFIHGNFCDMCNLYVLHPFNETLRVEHHRQCLAEHENAMEAAFAEARSIDKQCGICMELIVERQLRFGILENCKHCYCLSCIRKWRQRSEQFTSKIIRSCPECRVVSDYIIPSTTWVEDLEEKKKVIEMYHKNMKQKDCKYTKLGRFDDCPFGNKCFYKHQTENGLLVEGTSPRELQRRRRLLHDIQNDFFSADEDDFVVEVFEQISYSLNGRNNRVNRRRN